VKGVFATWWHKAMAVSVMLAILCGATVVLCVLFRRELTRRLSAERALVNAARELSVMASTDALTGLLNRRAFEVELHREWRRVSRGSKRIALLMLDADWYKLYNDRYGHQEGDRALQIIAASIRKSLCRPFDVGARYGGEEFVVLLPDTDLPGAMGIAEAIRGALAAADVAHAESPLGRLTLSIGLAVVNPAVSDPATLIKDADEALYAAKRGGRNRVSVAAGSDLSFVSTLGWSAGTLSPTDK
jgi:diguanylate cyclase (GGDEF)-like protein